ncbi:GNAT family N-acetyltransferase [Flaviflexus massiliensis]|uniref:GNAT family N-acetyltransferase n=1 Tax=Flaviflexus massiliensis TaxID=1522309 RepID=UPI0006D5525B|nr:GNAT family N-acetyltransferase [Flaviflexus massiliensis]
MRLLGPADTEAFAQLDLDIFGVEAWPAGVIAEQLATNRIVAYGVDSTSSSPGEDGTGTVIEGGAGRLDAAAILALGIEAELLTISVRPERRREGLATRLITQLLTHAGKAEACFLEVRASDRGARSLYEGLGFVEVGRRKRYYRDDDAVVMRKELRKHLGNTDLA